MKRVLLIDDDMDDREIFETALGSLQKETEYLDATDGQEGIDLISRKDFVIPDIIFVDLNMPKVGGLEFITTARKFPAYKDLPIFIYSTTSVQEEQAKCMANGATGFIVKHSSYDELRAELKTLI